MKLSSAILAAAAFLPAVLAHGIVMETTIDGVRYRGVYPWERVKADTVIRRVDNTEPNHINPTGRNDKLSDVACGRGAATRGVKGMARAKPGSTMTFKWDGGNGDPWPHDSGPLITYIGKCIGSCETTDATKVDWVKIHQVGKKADNVNKWYQEDLQKRGAVASVKLPGDLPNGDYLVRHEIVALHLAPQTNGAELYPSCINVRVSGGSSSGGSGSPTVRFPGGYTTTDRGIKIHIWNDARKAYPFPGPAIGKFSGGTSVAQSNNSTSEAGGSEDAGSGSGSGSGNKETPADDGANDDYGEEEDCEDDSANNGSGSGSGSGSGATKTVTVTITVTATPTNDASSNSKGDYKRDVKMSPLKVRRSRAHNARARS